MLSADIMKCFDRFIIKHQKLLRKINVKGVTGRALKGWGEAGIMDGKELSHYIRRGHPTSCALLAE